MSWPMTVKLFLNLALVVSLLLSESKAKETHEATQSPVKDKKSAEDIMFGNQQNKPAGMVDDLLTLPERDIDNGQKSKVSDNRINASRVESKTKEKPEHAVEGNKSEPEKPSESKDESSNLDQQKFDYYDYLQEPDDSRLPYPSVEGYHLESIEEQNGKSAPVEGSFPDPQTYNPREPADYPEDDYDGVLYRRKRTPRRMPTSGSSYMRKRSIRSNLDDLLAGNRRRALRLKRDVGVEQFLAWLATLKGTGPLLEQTRLREEDLNEMDNAEAEEPSEIPVSFFYDAKPGNDWYNPTVEEAEEPLFPPGFLEGALARELKGEEQLPADVIPDWLNKYTVPPPYPILSRRSPDMAPASPKTSFYPLDYRYVLVPGQKKKKRDGHHRRMGGIQIQDLHEASDEPRGKWGTFPTHRRRPLSDEPDPDRLYALASLLAEESPVPESNGEELERRRRRAPKA